MAIKISKVIADLNVGRQTIEEFLHKKGIEIDASINARIDNDVYEMLVKEFKPDMDLKSKSDKMANERQKEKAKQNAAAKESHEIKTVVPGQKPTVLGKIDLNAVGKPKAAAKPAAKQESKPVEEPKPEKEQQPGQPAKPGQPKPAGSESAPAESSVPAAVEVETPQQESTPEAKPDAETAQPVEEVKENDSEDKVFMPVSETVGGPQLKVVGKVDLTSINQQTRPRKKSKEEKRNERIAKAQTEGGSRRKRKRIGKEKIDIETAGKQAASQPGKGGRGGKDDQSSKRNKDKKGNRKPLRPEVSEEDVQRQMKETLARLTAKNNKKAAAARRRERREEHREEVREEAAMAAAQSKILKLTEFVTANDLASMMNVPINKVIATCMNLGVMVSINQRLDAETINIVADEFGFKTEYTSAEVVEAISEEEDNPEDLVQRPPVVTVMGHVDHGKTSLLDYIRNSNVIAGEAGGITQHIGAYNVKLPNGRRITFLDTPGHEAFTAMRARGAKVTDIVIVIVAADDSVMPQTVEALNHASAAGVPIIFAINKIDKPGANPEKIKEELANMNYLVEDWGGKYQSQDISAKKGIGVSELMEKVLLEADMLDLKANPNRKATGSIIESSLDKGRGYIATVLVDNGTLRVGDIVLAGTHYGKVKAMFNERNVRITESGPSTPALILGLDGAPTAGDKFNVMDTTGYMRGVLPVWKELGFSFDAICTGLMFSEEQAQLVSAYCTEQSRRGTTIFVDPIMGDGGRLYNGITQRSVELMRQMVSVADLTFPNYTEACYLTSTPYMPEGMTWPEARDMLSRLRDIGCRSAIVTSARVDGQSCVVGYNHQNGEFFQLDYDEIPVLIHGTGDIFSAVLIGHLLRGEPLKQSTRTAMDVVSNLIDRNRDLDDKKRGIPIEKCLDLL